MLSERMSGHEMLEEYDRDLTVVQQQTLRYIESDYMQRLLHRHRRQQSLVTSKVFTLPNGNRYIGVVMFQQYGFGKRKGWSMESYHYGLLKAGNKLCAIAYCRDKGQAIKYTPHFFRRYKERFGHVCGWQARGELLASQNLTDLMAIYIKRNVGIVWIETEAVFRDKVHIFGVVNDGVVLLQWDNSRKVLQANTFVTFDMLDEKQAQMVYYAIKYSTLTEEERQKYAAPDFVSDE